MQIIESEKVLERKLKREVEKLGGWCIKIIPLHINGLPDRLCLLPGGRVFFAEVKTTKKKTTKIQKLIHNKLKRLGFTVQIIDTSEDVASLIDSYRAT